MLWVICRVFMPLGGSVYYFTQHYGWGKLKPREYLARFHPTWLKENPTRYHPEDLIVVLLQDGWEPYAFSSVGQGSEDYCFRRKEIAS